jgi:hypothetical protein
MTTTYAPATIAPATWWAVCECIDTEHDHRDVMSEHLDVNAAVKSLREDGLPSWAHVVEFTSRVVEVARG